MMSLITFLRTYNKRFFKKSFITLFTIAFLFSSISVYANPLAIRAGQVAVGAFKNAMKNPKFAKDTKALALALGLTYLTLPKDTTSTESNKLPKTFGQNCGIDGLVFKGVTMSEALNFFESYKDLKYLYTYRYEYSPHMMIDVYDVIGTKNGLERKYSIQCHNGGATNTSDFQDSVIDPSKHDELANDIVKAAAAGNSQAIELLNLAFSMSNPTMTQDEIDDLIEQLQKSATQSGTGTQTGTTTGSQSDTTDKTKDEIDELAEPLGVDAKTEIDLTLPKFCEWATWFCQDDPSNPNDEKINIDEVNWGNPANYDVDYLRMQAYCPELTSFKVPMGINTVEMRFDLTPLCMFAQTVRPAVISVSYFLAFIYAVGSMSNRALK